MGWTGIEISELSWNEKKKDYNIKGYLDKLFSYKDKNKYLGVVTSSMVGNVYYAAIRFIDEAKDEDYIFGEVVLTRRQNNFFYYKEMNEDMGPCYYDCPIGILNVLSFTNNEFAIKWREQCWKKHKEKARRNNFFKFVQEGAVIEYTLPKTFNEDYKEGDVIYIHSFLWYGPKCSKVKPTIAYSDGITRWPRKYIDINYCRLFKDKKEIPF